jgi:hypothetical protein
MGNLINKIGSVVGSMMAGGEVIASPNTESTPGTSIVYQKEQGSKLMKDLLRGEVTQEVEELRYRMYMIEEASRKYHFDPSSENGVSLRSADYQKPNHLVTKDWEVLLVQKTSPLEKGEEVKLEDVVMKEGVKFDEVYPLHIVRDDIIPRFYLERSCFQTVLKRYTGDEDHTENEYILELYFPFIPDPIDRIKRGLTLELQKVYEGKTKMSLIDDPISIEFTAYNAWGSKNNIKRLFNVIGYRGIQTLQENFYVVQYTVTLEKEEDLTFQYYSKSIQEKYDNREKRPNMNIPVNPFGETEEPFEICDVCGKKVKDTEMFDIRITRHDYGKGMCQKCYSRFCEKNNII